MRLPTRLYIVLCALATVVPATAQAQYRYPPMYPYPYGAYRYGYDEASLKIKVKPKEASVYVDGYFAGKVEDYDGVFERLHVQPGQHEIVVFMPGYRSLRQRLYLSPDTTRKIEGQLEKLRSGDPEEQEPQPLVQPEPQGPPPNRLPPPAGRTTRRPPPPPPPDRGRPSSGTASRYGTIEVRVQPSGATVFVDGERWAGPADADERLLIQVAEGRHHVEIEHDGYDRFVTEIDVRASDTAPLNVNLTRAR